MEEIKFITCSGVNEYTNVEQMLSLAEKYPSVEFGVQVSGLKCSFETPRYRWIHQVQNFVQKSKKRVNLALHINPKWVEGFCFNDLAPELLELLMLNGADDKVLFRRVQLNFKIGRDKTPDLALLLKSIEAYSTQERRFILSYNAANAAFIKQVYAAGCRFDCLYDTSHGEGITSEYREAPAFADAEILQGYAGGLSPENVAGELDKISAVMPADRSFFIDAEGRLKNQDGIVSLEKCESYIVNALTWQARH